MSDAPLEMKLEVVMLPVSDLDRAKAFYSEKVGFPIDFEGAWEGMNIIQFTPHGSGCSIQIGTGVAALAEMPPGSIRGLLLVVKDMIDVRDQLIARGVEVGEIADLGGVLHAGFADPDGNTWVLQQMLKRD